MSSKPKAAFYWCSSCGGCEETVVDLNERLIDVASVVDIVFWPCAMDFKLSDIEALDDRAIAVSFINGAVRTSEQEHVVKLLRRKSDHVIAFGTCATHGGIPSLANLTSKKAIFESSYHESPSVCNPKKVQPLVETQLGPYKINLPEFYETVHQLEDVIAVDYIMPGCPPTGERLFEVVELLLAGKLPPRGTKLVAAKSLCSSCPRNESKPDDLRMESIRRVIDVELDPSVCFLVQGVVCMGPATADGCRALCIEGNMPCTGCYGTPLHVLDQGAKMVAMLGGVLEGDEPPALQQKLSRLNDPAGTFYRYSVGASLLGRKRGEDK
jgi:F420-non-reducing hydrogenase small subunit